MIPGAARGEMDSVEVFKRCLELLRAGKFCALATALEAKPRVRAMEYAVADSSIIFMLTEGGRKVRDILLNPDVSIAVWTEDPTGVKGLMISARAEVVDPGDQQRFSSYYEEYGKCIGRKVPSQDALPPTVKLIRVIPDVMELFDPLLESKGYSSKQIWRR
jgi:general stress protein 26